MFNAAQWLVDRHVDEGRGDRVAIRSRGESTTYAQLATQIQHVQAVLNDLGVEPGDRVAMVVQDDLAFPSWFLGAMRSGVVPVALSTMLKPGALGEIVADSGAEVLVISDTFAAGVAEICAEAPTVRSVVVCGETGAAGDVSVDVRGWASVDQADDHEIASTTSDSPAFWLYSSGTTGTPKGVMHVHGNLKATADTYAAQTLKVTPDDRFFSIAKLFFAYGLGNSLTFPLSVGATAILEPSPPSPQLVADIIAAEQPTLFFASPGFCAALLDHGPDPAIFDSVRASVTAGESLPGPIQTRFAELSGGPVLDGIGSTELLHIFISNTLDAQSPGSSGWLVPGYSAELRGDDGALITEPDTPGYLHVQAPSASVGYHERPEATAAAFLDDGWVKTGDVYTRSADDCFTFLGRNNDMIKAGGIWVSPAEVESALIEHDDVMEAAVVGARDSQGLEQTVAFVLPATGASPDLDELQAHCRDRMAAFKRPGRIVVVDELPKTATGKIRRFQLRQQLEAQ